MSNQELQNQSEKKEDKGVNKRRRFIKGAGIAAPVVLTLTSPSVFGALCMSQMMSGNTSHARNGNCVQGVSPGAWRNPGGNIVSDSTIGAWEKAGFSYGTLKPGGNKKKCEDYNGGSAFNSAFGGRDTRPMREILCKGSHSDKSSGVWHLVAAMLNANYFKGTYILTPAQVIGVWNKSIPLPPPYTDLKLFLDSTWDKSGSTGDQ